MTWREARGMVLDEYRGYGIITGGKLTAGSVKG